MLKCFGCFGTARNSFKINSTSIPPRVRFVPEHERIQIDATYQTYDHDEFNAAELFDATSPPMPVPDIELSSDNDLANSTASSGFDYLPRAPAQILFPKFTNPDQLEAGSCYF